MVLLGVTMCYTVLQCVTWCYKVLHGVTVCYSVLQGVKTALHLRYKPTFKCIEFDTLDITTTTTSLFSITILYRCYRLK